MSDPRLIDMEPGGESTQYESIREFMVTPAKQTGQLGGQPHTKSLTTAIVDGTDSPASGEEDKQAQRLGMGVIEPNKGRESTAAEDVDEADNNVQKIWISTTQRMPQPRRPGGNRGMGPAPGSGLNST